MVVMSASSAAADTADNADTGQFQALLAETAARHGRLCPRQVLGVRIGLAAMAAFQLPVGGAERQLLVFTETDGCFVDGVEVATGCSVGHRTLRVHDYGKVAAVFVHVASGRALRIAPRPDVRDRAREYAPHESSRYDAQLAGYQAMPVSELLSTRWVRLHGDPRTLLGRAGVRACCSDCGEEVMNQREVVRGDVILCRSCAEGAYFDVVERLR